MAKGKILLADDEERMRKLVSDYLVADGYEVTSAADGREAIEFFDKDDFSLVILDIMMPHIDGYAALKKIKSIKNVPIILLTAKGGEYDELKGFSLGVDEYIKKPFRPKILVARVNALLSRTALEATSDEILSLGGVEVFTSSRKVLCEGKEVALTGKEYELLIYFLKNPNVALSRDSLLENVWDYEYEGDERTVDTHVKKLRAKLKDKGSLIKTIWGVGYKFEE